MDSRETLHANAAAAAGLLRALGNTSRLLILCRLFRAGESSAGSLAAELDIGASALSQHLTRMREEGLVSQRRQSRQVFYQISEASSTQLPSLLASICGDVPELASQPGSDATEPAAMGAILDLAFVSSGAMEPAGFWQTPAIQAAGRIRPLPQAAYQPDPAATYKLIFHLTMPAGRAEDINPALQRVARTVNLYANAGVPFENLRFVAVASGAATALSLDDIHYARQYGTPNPNLPVIEQLREAGVDVAVCGQAVPEHGYQFDWIDPRVTVALSALTTTLELQQKGYALMPL